jgi:hypothetical protein
MKKSFSALKLNMNDNYINKIKIFPEKQKEINYDNKLSLIKHKVFLNKILELIKISQIDFLSQKSFNSKNIKNHNSNNLNKAIKDILLNLKNELIITLKGNTENKAKIQNMMNNHKTFLVKSIFDFERDNVNNIKIKEENKKKIKKFSEDENYKYNIELPHLKLLNFKVENQLKYISVLIKLKMENTKDFKNESSKFDDFDFHIFCDNQNDNLVASNYLHNNLINIRDKFKLIVKNKENQNRNLIILNARVIALKEELELLGKKSSNDYVNTSDIINEESREYYTRTNICTIENHKNSNKELDTNNDFMKKNLIRINGN